MGRKVVLVARDAAPSGCFERLGSVLKEQGINVNLIIGQGKPLTKTIEEIAFAASHANVVVLGMSSSLELAEPEIAAGKAAKNAGVPYGFYGDAFSSMEFARTGAWFEEIASDAAFYFCVTQADADAAREVFQNAKLIGTGNPIHEEAAFPRFTREEVRTKLGITPEEKLVLVPGNKFVGGNMAMFAIVMQALLLLTKSGQSFQLIPSIHPGDEAPMELYRKLVSLSPVSTRIVDKDIFTTSEMIPGADIIVEHGSSIGNEAAYQNIPIVSLGLEILFRSFEKESGSRVIEVVDYGLSELVDINASKLANTIRKLLTDDGFAQMKAQQQKLYPKPKERGAALRKMADAIAHIIKKRRTTNYV